jgi:hypothetical protein
MVRLFEATSDTEIDWEEGADEAYFAIQKDANLHIRYVFDPDNGESAYTFRIVRGKNDAFFTVLSSEDDYFFMRNLYSAVSVNAAGGQKIVDDLFD